MRANHYAATVLALVSLPGAIALKAALGSSGGSVASADTGSALTFVAEDMQRSRPASSTAPPAPYTPQQQASQAAASPGRSPATELNFLPSTLRQTTAGQRRVATPAPSSSAGTRRLAPPSQSRPASAMNPPTATTAKTQPTRRPRPKPIPLPPTTPAAPLQHSVVFLPGPTAPQAAVTPKPIATPRPIAKPQPAPLQQPALARTSAAPVMPVASKPAPVASTPTKVSRRLPPSAPPVFATDTPASRGPALQQPVTNPAEPTKTPKPLPPARVAPAQLATKPNRKPPAASAAPSLPKPSAGKLVWGMLGKSKDADAEAPAAEAPAVKPQTIKPGAMATDRKGLGLPWDRALSRMRNAIDGSSGPADDSQSEADASTLKLAGEPIPSVASSSRRVAPPEVASPVSESIQAAATISSLNSGIESGDVPASTPLPERSKIIFRPAVVDVTSTGRPMLRPDVKVAKRQVTVGGDVSYVSDAGMPIVEGEVIVPDEWSAPVVSGPYEEYAPSCSDTAMTPSRMGPFEQMLCHMRARLNGPCGCEPGLGTERVMHAISFVDTAQPLNNFRTRLDAGYGWQLPDRSEYFWQKIGNSDELQPERSVDYQDIRAYLEMGGRKFSVGTDIPIRMIAPENNPDTAGLGDISITTKLVFLEGKRWMLTQLLRTYIPSGDAREGLGTGHASIEPGFAWRYKYSPVTYLHGDLKLWVPLGGDQDHAGEVITYGFAMSHVWSETDSYAVMPTLELTGVSFVDGAATVATNQFDADGNIIGVPGDVDADNVINIHPGVRWVWDRGSDCGIQEFGLSSGFALTSDRTYRSIMRFEARWSW
ncbi:MAG: hypothetical protein AAGJ46_03325 [Planctomycetota bacterium]